MNKAGRILSIEPKFAIPGGEVSINCEGLEIENAALFACFFNGVKASIVAASSKRVLAIVPYELEDSNVEIYFENVGDRSDVESIQVGKKLADDLHLVANPAVDPKDDSIILTRSGTRGQQLPVTLFRLESDGYLAEISAEVMNPTGVAFDQRGRLFVTNRANGEVVQISSDKEVLPNSSELGVPTAIAFDKEGVMHVGDRSGTIYRISDFGDRESWVLLEPSVSAYHLAFGLDGKLYVTAPGLCSHDSVYQVDEQGLDQVFFKGLGRPQGLAFDDESNLYVAACLKGKHGIVKISNNGSKAELLVSGMGIVGLCFNRMGEMIISTNDKVYSLSLGVSGILLD